MKIGKHPIKTSILLVQRNAKQAAEKHYTDALRRCDLSETFISGKAAKSRSFRETSPSVDSSQRY